jgi:hypothetical protein
VVLPSPELLSLSEAIELVKARCDCSNDEAKIALRRAGLEGRLEAIGSIPFSAHPDPTIRARHRARRTENPRASDWNSSDIDWSASTVGPYSSVLIKRASIQAWLSSAEQQSLPGSDDRRAERDTPAKQTAVKPLRQQDLEAAYKERMDTFHENHKRYPTFDEDMQWGKSISLTRDRVRGLRDQLRPPDAKKGGAPKKSHK